MTHDEEEPADDASVQRGSVDRVERRHGSDESDGADGDSLGADGPGMVAGRRFAPSADDDSVQPFYRRAELHEGPLPAPQQLASYGDIDPALPGQIVEMAQSALNAQIEIEQRASKAHALAIVLGAVTSAVLAVGGLGVAVVLLILGYSPAAIAVAIPAFGFAVARVIQSLRRSPGGS